VTYLQFHLLFMLPPLIVLATGARKGLRVLGRRAIPALIGVPFLALAYTTVWDSYLIRRGVWWYGPERVIGSLWGVPFEEYLFFLLQPLLTGLVFYRFAYRLLELDPVPVLERSRRGIRWVGAIIGGLWVVTGGRLLSTDPGTYMGLILVWAGPVLALMWAYRGEWIWRFKSAAIPGIVIPTVYLWVADRTAIDQGVWEISERYTLGLAPLGLPVEEATFFLLTNMLVVFGLILFLVPGLAGWMENGPPAPLGSDPVLDQVEDQPENPA
jgi:lycopene cyclase domain-containing protein